MISYSKKLVLVKKEKYDKNYYWIYEHDFDINNYKHMIMIHRNYICQISKDKELIKN